LKQTGYFGTINDVGDEVLELKWKNGRRIYYEIIPETTMLLLLGGNKNGQRKDITQAKKILKKLVDEA
jgi:putative addiction module killer protein